MLRIENESNDSDDDYELPNLAERVQASLKSRNALRCVLTSDSEIEENELQKVPKGNHSTPHTEIKYRPVFFLSESEDDEESEFLKSSVKFRSAPCSKFRRTHLEENSYEDLNGSYIPKFENRPVNLETSESDSDEAFSNIIENIRKSQTPMAQNRLKSGKGKDLQENKKFSHSSQVIKGTPESVSKIKDDIGGTVSDSDESFTNFIENIRKCQTPIVQKNQIYDKSDSDSDGAFSDIIEKLNSIQLAKSQTKNRRDFISPISEKPEFQSTSSKEAILQKSSSVRMMNKKEYAALFPSQHMHLSSGDQAVYGQKLFKFFNEKVFSSQLPADMPLIWSNSLLRAAGVTHCRYKSGIRSCHITLSSALLLSFDRLQDTLLHEMCHAAVWLISEGYDRHGPLWKTWASRCKLILPFVNCPERCHEYEVAHRIWYRCLTCDFRVGRCRQSRKLERSVCKKCKTPLVMTSY